MTDLATDSATATPPAAAALRSGGASVARRIEADMRRAIVTLALRPGTRLSEQEVAARYGVSRQPVREVFIALARAGLVEVHPRRGTVVVRISVDRLLEARFVREALECAVVRRACERFDARVRSRIDFHLDAQETATEAGDHYAFQRADELFHAALAEGAGCPAAWSILHDVKAHMDRACHLTLPQATPLARLIGQHREILAAVDRRDAPAAEAAIRAHLAEILRALPVVQAAHPDIFV